MSTWPLKSYGMKLKALAVRRAFAMSKDHG